MIELPAATTDFGEAPEPLLAERVELLDPARRILDLGAGIGRHALWLARRGWQVDALEAEPAVAAELRRRAEADALPVRVFALPFERFDHAAPEVVGAPCPAPPPRGGLGYGAVLVFGLLPVLAARQVEVLRARLSEWTAPGGLVFLTAFTNALGGGRWPTELAPGAIRGLLPTFEVIHDEEEIGPWHQHGGGPRHRHAWARAVFRRPAG